MPEDPFVAPISRHIWETKYRSWDRSGVLDGCIEDSWGRVARALASVEPTDRAGWAVRFYQALVGFRFLPGGRILAGTGTAKQVSLFNCFVMGPLEDALDGIFEGLKEGALTLQQGGGVGYDFSSLRPRGAPARRSGTLASGPVSFMGIWDSMCATLLTSGNRRGAMMATLRCDHPDIETFISAKRAPGVLCNFNLSVLVTDAFIEAVETDGDWPLVFPADPLAEETGEMLLRAWPGHPAPIPCRVWRRLPARRLWRQLVEAAYDSAEPGVLFVDRINQWNNLWYRETLSATNPCGEVPLPPYGACDLGAINLTAFVRSPFTPQAHLDLAAIAALVPIAVRLLDNVIELSGYPLPQQQAEAQGTRRIGLGITGLGDALLMLGLGYQEEAGRTLAADTLRTLCHSAYRASIALAGEKGAFPYLDRTRYLEGRFLAGLPADIRQGIQAGGIRNSHLISLAPTGTISLLANNISSGIEPVFDFQYQRAIREPDGVRRFELQDYALRRWWEVAGEGLPPPSWFAGARALPPEAHLAMQAALQPYVDHAISKTINLPETIALDEVASLYLTAYRLGLKGCTLFRPNPIRGAILASEATAPSPQCCELDRAGDSR